MVISILGRPVLTETANQGETNSFYEWVKRTKEEIEKIESGSSSDEDSEVCVREDIHMATAVLAPQFRMIRNQNASTHAKKPASLCNFRNSDSELEDDSESDDDEPPPLLLTRYAQWECSSDETRTVKDRMLKG